LKKIFIGLALFVIVLIAGFVGGMFYLGMEAEKQYKAMMRQISENSGVTVKEKSYSRGLLLSQAETEIGLAKSPLKLVIASTIHHGPIAIDDIISGRYGELKLITAKINSQVKLTGFARNREVKITIPVTTTIGILGNGNINLNLPPKTQKLANGDELHWQNILTNISFGKNLKTLKTSIQIPLLRIKKTRGGTIRLSQIRYTSDIHEGAAGYPLGKQRFAIGKFEVDPFFSANTFTIDSDSREVGGNINITAMYKIGYIDIMGEKYGPGQMVVDLRKLDGAALARFSKTLNSMYKKGMNAQQETIKNMQNFMRLLATLAKQAPELEVSRLSFDTTNGTLNGKAKFILDGRNRDLSKSPFLLFTALQGTVDLAVPPGMIKPFLATYIYQDLENYKRNGKLSKDELARLTPELIDKVIIRALPNYLDRNSFTRHLKFDGDRFTMTAKLQRGQLFINGKPLQIRMPTPR